MGAEGDDDDPTYGLLLVARSKPLTSASLSRETLDGIG